MTLFCVSRQSERFHHLAFSWYPEIERNKHHILGHPSNSRWHLLFLYEQVLYRWNRQSSTSVIETNKTSVELSLPFDEDYIIEIKPFSDGGDGSSSEQIRIPKISSKNAVLTLPSCLLWHSPRWPKAQRNWAWKEWVISKMNDRSLLPPITNVF